MQKLNRIPSAFLVPLLLALLNAASFAQDRTLPEEDFYGDVKRILMTHYTGKTVRTKLPIPASRRGLEMVDGTLQNKAEKMPPQPAAKVGDELTIKSFKVGDSNIEVLLAKNDPPPKRRIPNPLAIWRQPRINMRFTRELNVRDLTIENINRLLAPAVDVTTLIPPVPETAVQSPPQAPAVKPDPSVNSQNTPAPDTVTDLPVLGPRIGELAVECSVKEARVYIDGAYSGLTPRAIRLRAGTHTVLVVKDGFAAWEQRLFIPGAKGSVIRVELNK